MDRDEAQQDKMNPVAFKLAGALLEGTLNVGALYHLDTREKSGIIDLRMVDIDFVNCL